MAAAACAALRSLIECSVERGDAEELASLEAVLRDSLVEVVAARRSAGGGIAAEAASSRAAASTAAPPPAALAPAPALDPAAAPTAATPTAAATATATARRLLETPPRSASMLLSSPLKPPTTTPTTDATTVHVSPCVTYDPQEYIEAFSQFGAIEQVTPKGSYCFVTFATAEAAAAACASRGLIVSGEIVWVKARTPGIGHVPAGIARDICTVYVYPCPANVEALKAALAPFGSASAVTLRGKYAFVTFSVAASAAAACAQGRVLIDEEWIQLKPKTRRPPKGQSGARSAGHTTRRRGRGSGHSSSSRRSGGRGRGGGRRGRGSGRGSGRRGIFGDDGGGPPPPPQQQQQQQQWDSRTAGHVRRSLGTPLSASQEHYAAQILQQQYAAQLQQQQQQRDWASPPPNAAAAASSPRASVLAVDPVDK